MATKKRTKKGKESGGGKKYLAWLFGGLAVMIAWFTLGTLFIAQIKKAGSPDTANWEWSFSPQTPGADGFFSWFKNTLVSTKKGNDDWITKRFFTYLNGTKWKDASLWDYPITMLAPIMLVLLLIISSFLGFFGTFISAWENLPSLPWLGPASSTFIFWVILTLLTVFTAGILPFSMLFFLAQIMSGFQSIYILYKLFEQAEVRDGLAKAFRKFWLHLYITFFTFLTIYSFVKLTETNKIISSVFLAVGIAVALALHWRRRGKD